jgi:hypothetical protein
VHYPPCRYQHVTFTQPVPHGPIPSTNDPETSHNIAPPISPDAPTMRYRSPPSRQHRSQHLILPSLGVHLQHRHRVMPVERGTGVYRHPSVQDSRHGPVAGGVKVHPLLANRCPRTWAAIRSASLSDRSRRLRDSTPKTSSLNAGLSRIRPIAHRQLETARTQFMASALGRVRRRLRRSTATSTSQIHANRAIGTSPHRSGRHPSH